MLCYNYITVNSKVGQYKTEASPCSLPVENFKGWFALYLHCDFEFRKLN